MFTGIGNRLTPESFEAFEKVLKENLNNVVDRGYQVFKNNAGQLSVAKNFPPTKEVLKETVDYYKKIAAQKGYDVEKLGNEVFERLVANTWRGATMNKGFITSSGFKPGQVIFGAPGVKEGGGLPEFLAKSVASDLNNGNKTYIKSVTTSLEDVTGVDKEVIQKLLGKTKNPMSTLVDGVTNLSAQVRSGQAFDDMVIKNNELKVAWNKWTNGFKQIDPKTKQEVTVAPKTGPEPEVPFLFDDLGEAQKFAEVLQVILHRLDQQLEMELEY